MFDLINASPVDETELNKRIGEIDSAGLTNLSRLQALKFILGIIDLTTLEGTDTEARIIELCSKASSFYDKEKGIPNNAAVCVYPPFVSLAKKKLSDTAISVASVAGAFPSGQSPLAVKLEEVKYVIDKGADEVDMVISRGMFLENKFNEVFDEIAAIKQLCGNRHLKVILETGELITLDNVKKASELAINAGADFIKTSTGKISPAATKETVLVMLDVIKEHFAKTGKRTGIKPAGGISEPAVAIDYLKLVDHTLGKHWLDKNYFRIGASRLADKVYREILVTDQRI